MKKRSRKTATSNKEQSAPKSFAASLLAVVGSVTALDGLAKAVEHLLAFFAKLL